LRESIDWPLDTQPPRPRRRTFLFLIAIVAVIVFGSRTALSYWVDLLWFRSLGYGESSGRHSASSGASSRPLPLSHSHSVRAFSALKRAHSADLPTDHTIFIAGNAVNLPVASSLRLIAIVPPSSSRWRQARRWRRSGPRWPLFGSPHSTEACRPHLRHAAQLLSVHPAAWQLIAGWLLTLAVIAVSFPSCSSSSRAAPVRSEDI